MYYNNIILANRYIACIILYNSFLIMLLYHCNQYMYIKWNVIHQLKSNFAVEEFPDPDQKSQIEI